MTLKRVLGICVLLGVFCATQAQDDLLQKIQEYRQKGMNGAISSSPSVSVSPQLLSGGNTSSGAGTPSGSVLLDKKIDPDEYVLGPGDKLIAYLWGITEKEYELPVTSEGKVIIPLVGELRVAGSTLTEARKAITDTLLKVHRRVEISVTLAQLRLFKTFLTGSVANPGACIIDGATRVSDILEITNPDAKPIKRRNILLTSADGDVRSADLARFYNANILESNPYVREGERVFVPPTTQTISVFGEVHQAGTFDYMENDNLAIVLQAAGGLTRNADSTRVVLTRFVDATDQLEHIDLRIPDDLLFEIHPDDRVLVQALEEYRVHRNVTIEGEVRYPGTYPIRKDKTHLTDVIAMAGGVTDEAYLEGSFVLRNWDMNAPAQKPSPDRLVSIINATNAGGTDIPPSELTYLKSEFLESDGKVAVNFKKALADKKSPSNILLREGDRIVITRTSLTVRVMGSVVSPGLVPHAPDHGISDYLALAGGLNRRAHKSGILVKKVGTDVWVKPRKVTSVDPGDIVLVPEKPYRDGFNLTRDVLGIAGSVATVILGFLAISDYAR